MKIHCMVHLEFETLGNIRDWAADKGYLITQTVPSENAIYPDPSEFDLLIIMGGLMSVYQEDDYPWLKQEKQFVKKTMLSGKAIYGICFGAQMLAEILGTRVFGNEFREIGWHKVRSLDVLQDDDSLFRLPDEFMALQWHGDTFNLPEGARRLFESEACSEQGFVYGENILAVQFHPEVDRIFLDNLIFNCSSDLTDAPYIQSENEILNRDDLLVSSSFLMFTILDWFEDVIKRENISEQDSEVERKTEHMRSL